MTVAKLNSRIQSMTALEGEPSGPGSPASQSTAVPGLTPSPGLSVQASLCLHRQLLALHGDTLCSCPATAGLTCVSHRLP